MFPLLRLTLFPERSGCRRRSGGIPVSGEKEAEGSSPMPTENGPEIRKEDIMRMVFVRHGEPDYEKDCLTEIGKKQAEAAAERLEREGIAEIYASPMGRAAETAAFTAKRLGLTIQTLPFMHEISWGGPGVPQEGHPWTLSDWMIIRDDFDFFHDDWRKHPSFENNAAVKCLDEISARIDAFLLEQRYRHEGTRFFC